MFDFASARTADQTMDELERFIMNWLGPRLPEYGEPEATVAGVRMPAPLRRLHAFAGRWPARDGRRGGGSGRAFHAQDCLIPLSRLGTGDEGRVVFLHENQGVWSCAADAAGDDLPVFVAGELNGAHGYGRWGLVSDSLTRFLVTFCLQECLLGSATCVTDGPLAERYGRGLGSVEPLWEDGRYPYEQRYAFDLMDDNVFVGRMRGTTYFATNRAARRS